MLEIPNLDNTINSNLSLLLFVKHQIIQRIKYINLYDKN